MNIVKFFQDLANRWDAEQKCGFCWAFSAPLSESGMNSTAVNTPCCTHLFLTYIRNAHGYKNSPQTGLKSLEWCDVSFTLYAVQNTNLGINTYNETPNHPISESLWSTILEPLNNCLGCGNEINLCEMGYPFEIIKWDMETAIYHHDNNYTGWKINATFRTYKNQ